MDSIALNPTQKQLSPVLLESLAQSQTIINGDAQKLVLFKLYLETILEIGIIEHSGDWDPYLEVGFLNGQTLDTVTGYTDIVIGDFNEEDNEDIANMLLNSDEITSIGFYTETQDEDGSGEAIITYYDLSSIKYIKVIPF